MTTAQAIVRFLSEQYVGRDGYEQPFFAGVLGIFGHGNVTGMGKPWRRWTGSVITSPATNKRAVHIAAGYAKVKNRLQTFACTSSVGPGATNMVTGAGLATINRLPVLLFPGDIFANAVASSRVAAVGASHESRLERQRRLSPRLKFWDRINRPEQILSSLPEAMRILTDPAETGAVTLACPRTCRRRRTSIPSIL